MIIRRILLVGFAAIGLAAQAPAQQAAETQRVPAEIRLPRGTEIRVRTDYGISSKAARVDDAVYLKVAQAGGDHTDRNEKQVWRHATLEQSARSGDDQDARGLCPFAGRWRGGAQSRASGGVKCQTLKA